MEKIGIMIGSFNPIHNGHLMMAGYLLDNSDLSKVLIVPSPKSFGKPELISFSHRTEMIRLTIKEVKDKRLDWSDIETYLSGYTIDTLDALSSPTTYKYVLIIGADNFPELVNFHRALDILKKYEIYVLDRNNVDVDEMISTVLSKIGLERKDCKGIESFCNFPETKLSSSFIRKQVKDGKKIWAYVPKKVNNYIKKFKLYKS